MELHLLTAAALHWKRNLWVCFGGSFTTMVGMTLLLPFLPLYVEELGASGLSEIAWWSGVAYAATFLTAAIVAPLWGRIGDRYGRKLTLIRASLGMAIAISLIGLAGNVWQLVALRALTGLLGGYASGSMTLVAVQTPREHNAWALGTLSSGIMAGSLVGPLVGGFLPPLMGIRNIFYLSGAVISIAFLATALLIVEDKSTIGPRAPKAIGNADRLDRPLVARMLMVGMLLTLANFSIEPILTIYVGSLVEPANVTIAAGLVMAAAALGSIVSAPHMGRLADRIGPTRVIAGGLTIAALLLVPQAFVTAEWQLLALRLMMGLALGGLLPCIASLVRHAVPDQAAGTVLGLSTSAQYAGQVIGPLAGGFVGGHYGPRTVFAATSLVMLVGALLVATARDNRMETG
ncbi:MFS transporter [Sphingomonas arantia]|uniref:MFS transporter n=1 Tax=Sphingomonas arantia TaxID=1460676 RepID=A0ABW4TZT6_9SPHN